jgi:DNA helicase-2/ATP-dependent DNA helicase PcrA
MISFIGTFKKSGITADEMRAILEQNLAGMEYLAGSEEFATLLEQGTPRKKADKEEYCCRLQAAAIAAGTMAPAELKKPLVSLPGVYTPYVTWFAKQFEDTVLFDEGKTAGWQHLRDDVFFAKDANKKLVFKDIANCKKLLSAVNVYESYEAFMAKNGFYDFDDMINDAIAAIEEHPELRYTLQDRFAYVLADEFQDTNGSQMRILELLAPPSADPKPNILAVGDDDQAIMRFQGASVEYINQFEANYPGTKRIVLQTNYRSVPSIVNLGQLEAECIENRSEASQHDKQLAAARQEEASIEFTAQRYASKDMQYQMVAKRIKEQIDAGFMEPYTNSKGEEARQSIAVIAKGHRSLRALIPYLNEFGVPFEYKVTSEVGKLPCLQGVLAAVRFVAAYAQGHEGQAVSELPQVIASEELGVPVEVYLDFAARQKHATGKDGWLKGLKASSDAKLRDIYSWLMAATKKAVGGEARSVICDIAEPFGDYYRSLVEAEPFRAIQFNSGLRALLDFAEGELSCTNAEDAPESMNDGSDEAQYRGRGMMRLADVANRLQDAEKYAVDINVDVPIGSDAAVMLTTAHSSKGLEWNQVYIIDADQDTWFKGHGGSDLSLSGNMLFGATQDKNDTRRLLFVAITRARDELAFTLGRKAICEDLLEVVAQQDMVPQMVDLVAQAENCWQQRYYPQNAQLLEAALPLLQKQSLSVSTLNAFVEYSNQYREPDETDTQRLTFVVDRLLGLPSAPNPSSEFGTLVHSFMEEFVGEYQRKGRFDASILASALASAHSSIGRLDFSQEALEQMHNRLDLVAQKFVPWYGELLASGKLGSRLETECSVEATVDGVPLYGKCDLLAFDDSARTITILDYKTGKLDRKPDAIKKSNYMRQLAFYRLLLENSPDYQGYTLAQEADLYVEPESDTGELPEPQKSIAGDSDLAHLRLLAQAAWWRMTRGDYDVSAFETSPVLAAAVEACGVTKEGKPKTPTKAELQEAFEQWLIADWQERFVG